MSEDKLTRDDLVLLMESYRNMITMHQTILDHRPTYYLPSQQYSHRDPVAQEDGELRDEQPRVAVDHGCRRSIRSPVTRILLWMRFSRPCQNSTTSGAIR